MYKVYLVDDDRLILEELVNNISWMDNGFNVVGSTTSPEQALVDIKNLEPHAIFCDLKMPGMDGNELVCKIKEFHSKCEFVMISAYDSFEDVRAFFKNSGFDYVLKPVNSEEMQLVLEKLQKRLHEKWGDIAEGEEVSNPNFLALVEYVNQNYNSKITLDILAKKFNFSKNYICNLFSKKYHTSLNGYITALRMAKAKELLTNKNILIKDVAISCGYPEYYHFFKVFKGYYGESPKDMQNRL